MAASDWSHSRAAVEARPSEAEGDACRGTVRWPGLSRYASALSRSTPPRLSRRPLASKPSSSRRAGLPFPLRYGVSPAAMPEQPLTDIARRRRLRPHRSRRPPLAGDWHIYSESGPRRCSSERGARSAALDASHIRPSRRGSGCRVLRSARPGIPPSGQPTHAEDPYKTEHMRKVRAKRLKVRSELASVSDANTNRPRVVAPGSDTQGRRSGISMN